MNDKQCERFLITINNPLEKELTHEKILEILTTKFKTLRYVCMADEQGSCYHTHIFICFTSRVRFSKIKKYFPTAHIDNCKGNTSDNIAYVSKTGKWENDKKKETQIVDSFEAYGNPPPDSKGKNADMSELYGYVCDGLSNAEIISINQDFILQIDKIDKLRTTILTDKFKNTRRLDLCVTYIHGTTGTGKTRYVLDKHGDSNVYRVIDYTHPYDLYDCQPVIVYDEFRDSLHLKDMLNYIDIYPIDLVARYTNRVACYTQVYIISNWALEKQFTHEQRYDKVSWKAFLRRIHKVMVFNENETLEYDSVEEYFEKRSEWDKAE